MINQRFVSKLVEEYKSVWIFLVTCPDGTKVYAAKDFYGWVTEARTIEELKEKVDIML